MQQVQGQHRLELSQGGHPGIAGNDAVKTGGQDCRPGDQGVDEFPEKVRLRLVSAVAKHQNFHGVVQGPDPGQNVVVLLGAAHRRAADDVAAVRVTGQQGPDQGRGGVLQVPGDQDGFIVGVWLVEQRIKRGLHFRRVPGQGHHEGDPGAGRPGAGLRRCAPGVSPRKTPAHVPAAVDQQNQQEQDFQGHGGQHQSRQSIPPQVM